MPRSKSVLKRQRQSERRRVRNLGIRSELKTFEKRARRAIAGEGEATEELQAAQKRLDKAASKGTIHRNKASRKKSRLARAFNKAKASVSA